MTDVVVAGQIARDLVLVVDEVPAGGGSATVAQRREMLGGKGANQAVALAQLGIRTALVGAVGDDDAGEAVLAQARRDGLDLSGVIRREGTRTGLIVDIVDAAGRWRYLEDLPPAVLLSEADIAGAAGLLRSARWVSLQLQQPAAAVLAAAALAKDAGCQVALDGAPAGDRERDDLLALADVVRADAKEAELLGGAPVRTVDDGIRAAREVLRRGPSLAALAVGDLGNVVAWPDGQVFVPLTDTDVADTTGAGDAFTAALIASLASGDPPERAARLAVAAAGATAGHPGGRPNLTRESLEAQLALLAAAGA